MGYEDEEYRKRRKEECRKLFSTFEPNFYRSRDPARNQKILEMTRDGFFSREIAEAMGISPKAVQKVWRRYNFPSLHNYSPPIREERPNWEGGVKIVKGYAYSRTPWHPRASKYGGYVAVHRLVMEKKLGRYLTKTEVVDHIDGNPTNNHPDNLRVFPNNAEHLRVTLKGKCPNWTEDGKRRLREARTRLGQSLKDGAFEPNPSE